MNDKLIQSIDKLKTIVEKEIMFGTFGQNEEYFILRREIISEEKIKSKLPDWLKKCRNLSNIKDYFNNYSSIYRENVKKVTNDLDQIVYELEFPDELNEIQNLQEKNISILKKEYFHVCILSSKNNKEYFKWDETKENIIEIIMKPFVNNDKIIIDGFSIKVDEISKVQIKSTEKDMKNLVYKRIEENKKLNEKSINNFFENMNSINQNMYEKPGLLEKITEISEFENILSENLFDTLLKKYKLENQSLKNQRKIIENKIGITKEEKISNCLLQESIFISHSSKDKKYAESLVELLIKKGINPKKIRCTSFEETGFKLGEIDFLEKIKLELLEKPLFICLFSENYLKSPICLNEMGAGWITSDNYFILLTPETDFNLLKNTVFERVHSIKIDEKSSIAKLLSSIKNIFLLEELDFLRKDKIITDFLSDVQKLNNKFDDKDLNINKDIQVKEDKNLQLNNETIAPQIENKLSTNILLIMLDKNASLGNFLLTKKEFFIENILSLNKVNQIQVLNSIEETYVNDTGHGNYKNYEIFGAAMHKIIKTTKYLEVKKIALEILRGCSEYRSNLVNIYQSAQNEIIFEEFGIK